MTETVKAKLRFDYCMQLDYSQPIAKSFFTIKGLPVSDHRQRILDPVCEIEPRVPFSEGWDSFGNRYLYGSVDCPHSSFAYRVSGFAEIGDILYEEPADPNSLPMYRHPYGLNCPGAGLRAYYETLKKGMEDDNPYVKAVFLMHRLYEDFEYAKNCTGIRTTAEQAWTLGQGVCQDYVHIYLALCHMAGIPARYAAGMIIGEGESHAWAEIEYRGRWIGMDPTNDLLVARSHIKFGHGRDASDCLINRGLLRGFAEQRQSVCAKVELLEGNG